MLDFLVLVAASADGGSKAAFSIIGVALAVVAALTGALGIARPAFAAREGTARAIIGGTAVLVVATLAAVVATS